MWCQVPVPTNGGGVGGLFHGMGVDWGLPALRSADSMSAVLGCWVKGRGEGCELRVQGRRDGGCGGSFGRSRLLT